MIPLHITISGFLSYREPVEIDFSPIDLACIAGQNGAGKSSLLDAMTWALFGQARKRDESIINSQSTVAEVALIFAYEGNIYRIQRTLPRGKTNVLEFHILQASDNFSTTEAINGPWFAVSDQYNWKPLTERTLRETQARIEKTLSLDYDTFVNASFFLQGKADQFTQQRPGDRKRILGNILGLEVWETYRQRSADRRKNVEGQIAALDGRLAEIKAELAEEDTRKSRLAALETDLRRIGEARAVQESALENIRKIAATLEEQAKLVNTLARQLDISERKLEELQSRLTARQLECKNYAQIVKSERAIREAYAAWQQARLELERWEGVAAQFREGEKRRQGPLTEIEAERARLSHEVQLLQRQKSQIDNLQAEARTLQEQLVTAGQARDLAEQQLAQRSALEKELEEARQRLANARAENPHLKAEMEEIKERIANLDRAEGADCPLCGQPLSQEDRQSLVEDLKVKGKELGDRYRANKTLLEQSDQLVRDLEGKKSSLNRAEEDLRGSHRLIDGIVAKLEANQVAIHAWDINDAPRLAELEASLARNSYALEARQRLAQIDAELKAIGYDAAAHDAARKAESDGRSSEDQLRSLERAQAALVPLEREIADLQTQAAAQESERTRQSQEHTDAAAALAAAQAQAPDLYSAERQLFSIKEQENRLRMEVGAARQKVLVLDELKARNRLLDGEREQKARLAGQYRQLERAFSKDGVPALLIEQALPQIEAKSNEILERLTGGNMSVRFVTQAAYKDKKREDLRETLDIQISDGSGTRDYEMFSGGEGFRVNFAIRLALSEVLAKRAGARLQTLVIDEGFGSQDAQGRQRLIEAINLVRHDFSKILVITHIDELKDAFPNRIEVEKTPQGSVVRVL